MALPENVPTETIQLDRPRTIALTLGAMRRIKEATGEHADTVLLDPAKVLDRLGTFIWALLVNEDRDISIEDMEELLHPGNLPDVQAAISALVKRTSEGAGPGKATARRTRRAK